MEEMIITTYPPEGSDTDSGVQSEKTCIDPFEGITNPLAIQPAEWSNAAPADLKQPQGSSQGIPTLPLSSLDSPDPPLCCLVVDDDK